LEQQKKARPGKELASTYHDLLSDAICVVDPTGNCVNVSGACERIFGYTPAEMVGKNMLDLVHPDDLARTLQSIERVMAGYQQSYFENRYIRKDGSVVAISWSAAWSEEHQVRVGVARDISRRVTDDDTLVVPQLLPQSIPCWQLLSAPRSLLAPDGIRIALSAQDHAVLLALMSEERVVTRRAVVEALGESYMEYDQRRLDTQMRRLRKKVAQACSHILPVSTLRSVGFQFCQKATVVR
jgi:PAS domain S-box-containing protein